MIGKIWKSNKEFKMTNVWVITFGEKISSEWVKFPKIINSESYCSSSWICHRANELRISEKDIMGEKVSILNILVWAFISLGKWFLSRPRIFTHLHAPALIRLKFKWFTIKLIWIVSKLFSKVCIMSITRSLWKSLWWHGCTKR